MNNNIENKRLQKINEPLKLMRWAIDGFPPIDLNEQFMHVVELTKEIRKLRQQINPNKYHIEENNTVANL